eukprot:TRINITY_DN3690_c0_g1_i6.p1 TRINITY_DN3690_c0_g1~~TRINITY_DN3690_c0_g1_i6.p1  ORF type:complete len:384 (-),score=59.46 TRINITY_DN3690_c0_g1_i6:101-1252(-)
MKALLCLCVLLVGLVSSNQVKIATPNNVSSGPSSVCGTYLNGSYVSMSGLFASNGSYTYQYKDVTFELQVCGNVQSNFGSSCSVASPVNMYNHTSSQCTNLGDITTVAWNMNPASDGVYVTYYHGSIEPNNIYQMSTRIYFYCNQNETSSTFVQMTDRYLFEFSVQTPLACPLQGVSTSTSTGSLTTTTTTGGTTGNNLNYNVTTTCGRYFNGTFVDLSPLFTSNGSYVMETLFATYEIQVCANVKTNYPSACKVPSPGNFINKTTGECIYLGDINVVSWDLNPSGNGVYIQYFHGQLDGSVYQRATRIYFQCDITTSADTVAFEHESVESQYHFTVNTINACSDFMIQQQTQSGTTTGSNSSTAHIPSLLLSFLVLLMLLAM